jgi:hypothetical protein
MHIKASKLQSIDDFIDCALFGIQYISVDADYVVSKKKDGFGNLISAVPLQKSRIVMESNTMLSEINKALTICNPNVLQFNHNIDLDSLSVYKKNYKLWKLIASVKEAKKYNDICDAFVIDYENIDSLMSCKEVCEKSLIIIPKHKDHVEKIADLTSRSVIIDIDYDNNEIYNFEQNHGSIIN